MKSPANVANRLNPRPVSPAGFTLVEMLVAVALVVLMLMLFAQIFGDTVRIMREQQSLSQNDQKARSVESLIRSDLARMSFRQPRAKGVTGIVPLRENWPIDPDRQRGYFYISENDVESGIDDVLQFTIDGRETHRAPNVIVYKGRAAAMAANADISPGAAALDVNQPDWDDGNFGDNVGESHAAEVVYFLRGGNLYRRQMLLREPRKPVDPDTINDSIVPPSEFDAQPGLGPYGSNIYNGQLYTRKFVRLYSSNWVEGDYLATLDASVTPGLADFWNDFDYSAWNWWHDGNTNGTIDSFAAGSDRFWLMFNSVDSLKNVPGAASYPVGMPQYRFGHRPPYPINANMSAAVRLFEGMPVEYLLQGNGLLAINTAVGETKLDAFIGRYTHEETSSPVFGYPGVVPADVAGVNINPFVLPDPTASVSYAPGWDALNKNSIIDVFEGGPRAGEDLVLANVESFDIEVWDDGFSEPDLNGNGLFDAFEDRNADGFWQRNEDVNGNGQLDAGEDLNGNGLLDTYEARWVNLGHAGYLPGTTTPKQLGFYFHSNNLNWLYGPRPILPLPSYGVFGADGAPGIRNTNDNGLAGNDEGYEDVNGNGVLDMGEDINNNGQLDTGETGWPYSDDVWNRCYDTWHAKSTAGVTTQLINTGNFASVYEPPFRPTRIPLRIGPSTAYPSPPYPNPLYTGTAWQRGEDLNFNGTLDPGEDLNGNGALDGTVTYSTIIFPGHEDRNYNGILDPSEDSNEVDANNNGVLEPSEDTNGNGVRDLPNGILDPGEDLNNNGILDGPEDRNGNGVIDSDLSYFYMPVKIAEDANGNHRFDTLPATEDTDGNGFLNGYTNSSKEPEWPREPGATVVDGTTVWKCFDNRVGLQMIRITIRYRDPASGAPRQVSIIHSFVE